jgi:hypothetical protein
MLSQAQLAVLKASINADPALAELSQNDDTAEQIAVLYNQAAAPDFWVWRTEVAKGECVNSVGPDGTTFNWTGNGFIGRTEGERAAWREIFNGTNTVNPSLANVRSAFADIFSGSGIAAANRTHLLAVSRRKTTRAERLFATGTGSTVDPGLMVVEGQISRQDVASARELA